MLKSKINVADPIDKRLIMLWHTALSDILATGVEGTGTIEPVVGRRYRFDYLGLLTYLSIPSKYHYPYMIANKYNTPTAYLGDIYTITMLKHGVLESYYTAFTR